MKLFCSLLAFRNGLQEHRLVYRGPERNNQPQVPQAERDMAWDAMAEMIADPEGNTFDEVAVTHMLLVQIEQRKVNMNLLKNTDQKVRVMAKNELGMTDEYLHAIEPRSMMETYDFLMRVHSKLGDYEPDVVQPIQQSPQVTSVPQSIPPVISLNTPSVTRASPTVPTPSPTPTAPSLHATSPTPSTLPPLLSTPSVPLTPSKAVPAAPSSLTPPAPALPTGPTEEEERVATLLKNLCKDSGFNPNSEGRERSKYPITAVLNKEFINISVFKQFNETIIAPLRLYVESSSDLKTISGIEMNHMGFIERRFWTKEMTNIEKKYKGTPLKPDNLKLLFSDMNNVLYGIGHKSSVPSAAPQLKPNPRIITRLEAYDDAIDNTGIIGFKPGKENEVRAIMKSLGFTEEDLDSKSSFIVCKWSKPLTEADIKVIVDSQSVITSFEPNRRLKSSSAAPSKTPEEQLHEKASSLLDLYLKEIEPLVKEAEKFGYAVTYGIGKARENLQSIIDQKKYSDIPKGIEKLETEIRDFKKEFTESKEKQEVSDRMIEEAAQLLRDRYASKGVTITKYASAVSKQPEYTIRHSDVLGSINALVVRGRTTDKREIVIREDRGDRHEIIKNPSNAKEIADALAAHFKLDALGESMDMIVAKNSKIIVEKLNEQYGDSGFTFTVSNDTVIRAKQAKDPRAYFSDEYHSFFVRGQRDTAGNVQLLMRGAEDRTGPYRTPEEAYQGLAAYLELAKEQTEYPPKYKLAMAERAQSYLQESCKEFGFGVERESQTVIMTDAAGKKFKFEIQTRDASGKRIIESYVAFAERIEKESGLTRVKAERAKEQEKEYQKSNFTNVIQHLERSYREKFTFTSRDNPDGSLTINATSFDAKPIGSVTFATNEKEHRLTSSGKSISITRKDSTYDGSFRQIWSYPDLGKIISEIDSILDLPTKLKEVNSRQEALRAKEKIRYDALRKFTEWDMSGKAIQADHGWIDKKIMKDVEDSEKALSNCKVPEEMPALASKMELAMRSFDKALEERDKSDTVTTLPQGIELPIGHGVAFKVNRQRPMQAGFGWIAQIPPGEKVDLPGVKIRITRVKDSDDVKFEAYKGTPLGNYEIRVGHKKGAIKVVK